MRNCPFRRTSLDEGPYAVRRYQDEHRLAYQAEAAVNWCPALGTVLANEEVTDGKSERGGHPVQRLPLRQWMLRITAYADRLERDLEALEWPESIKILQRNWIGRSEGAEVDFFLGSQQDFAAWRQRRSTSGWPRRPGDDVLRVYTTRPDTLFGATYMVLAPEHPLVDRMTSDACRADVDAYRTEAGRKSDLERTELAKEKVGRIHRRLCDQPGQRKSHSRLDCGLRPVQLRHGGHYGGPGPRRTRF